MLPVRPHVGTGIYHIGSFHELQGGGNRFRCFWSRWSRLPGRHLLISTFWVVESSTSSGAYISLAVLLCSTVAYCSHGAYDYSTIPYSNVVLPFACAYGNSTIPHSTVVLPHSYVYHVSALPYSTVVLTYLYAQNNSTLPPYPTVVYCTLSPTTTLLYCGYLYS
jgi:hypothetical protein